MWMLIKYNDRIADNREDSSLKSTMYQERRLSKPRRSGTSQKYPDDDNCAFTLLKQRLYEEGVIVAYLDVRLVEQHVIKAH